MKLKVRLDGGLLGRHEGGRLYRAVLIRPGEWKGKHMRCSVEVLQQSVPKFEGVSSFLNPPAPDPGQHGYPGLERLLGVTENARWDSAENAIVADYRLADTPAAHLLAALVDGWFTEKEAGHAVPDIGLSAVPWVHVGPPGADGTREVLAIEMVEQVDAVYSPAAGGGFLKVLNSFGEWEEDMENEVLNQDVPETVVPDAATSSASPLRDGGLDQVTPMVAALKESVLEARLSASGLPLAFQRVVREGLPARWGAPDLDAAIGRLKAACAEDEGKRTVQGVRPQVSGMQDSLDQITEAAEALIEGRAPRRGVRPLSGARELYLQLSGDYGMTGMFHGERVSLANVNSTSMSNIVANVLNKVVAHKFQQYPRWWEPVVRRETFGTLQTIKWVMLGGPAELPVVSEGAAYTELTMSDAAQSATWQKRGGFLGITLEALDKDDTGLLRSLAPALARSAWLTMSKTIAKIFTDNAGAGPLLSDGVALFDGAHGNLGSAALDNTSWSAARVAMRKQAELNSGERLGALTAPRFLLIPPDLENMALTVLGSEGLPGTPNNDVNPEAAGATHEARLEAARRRIIVVDLWSDVNNWAAVADPQIYPTIGLAFRYGETPEVFSVASPATGLMFTNDVMPVKVRWFFAAGPMDHRGLYKANVA